MTDNTNRISKLELKTDAFENDIHEIKNDVHDIKKDVEDGKRVTSMNTKEIKDTNKLLTNIDLRLAGYSGGFKVIVWVVSSVGGLLGLKAIVMSLVALNGS